jgi:hypothetical protein
MRAAFRRVRIDVRHVRFLRLDRLGTFWERPRHDPASGHGGHSSLGYFAGQGPALFSDV